MIFIYKGPGFHSVEVRQVPVQHDLLLANKMDQVLNSFHEDFNTLPARWESQGVISNYFDYVDNV
jgi:hypothetical protein